MSKIKSYFVTLVIVFIVQITVLSVIFLNVKNNGYNPNNDTCGSACFKKMDVTVSFDENGDAMFYEVYHAYREKAGNYIYVDHAYDQALGEEIDKSSIILSSFGADGELEPIFEKAGTITQTRFKINTPFKGDATFMLTYKVKGLIKNVKDGQIFKYNFFNNQYSRPVMDAKITIKLPYQAFEGSTLWFDGLKSQSRVKKNTATYDYSIDIPKHEHTKQFYEVNMTFPKNSFMYASQIPKASYSTIAGFNKEIEKIIESDKAKAAATELKLFVLLIGTIVAFPIPILILLLIYYKKEKPYRKIDNETANWNIPAHISPLTASMVIAKENLADLNAGFKADILYLVSKGYVSLTTENDVVIVTKLKELMSEPVGIESLYQFLFDNKNETRLSKNRGYIKEEQDNFKQYCDKTLANFQAMDLYETSRGGYKSKLKVGLKSQTTQFALLYLMLSLVILITSFSSEAVSSVYILAFLLLIVVISLLAWYASSATRLREDKITIYEQWNGYKNYLSNYTLLKERSVNDIFVWKQHLAYATAFGVAENVLKVLKTEFPELATAVESDMPLGTGFYIGSLIGMPSVGTSATGGGFGSFGSGGGFSGGGFSGGGSGGGGGGFG